MLTRALFAFVLGATLAPFDALAQSVSSCGETVTAGVLTGDLDCSGSMYGVVIEDDGSLDLAGYTLVAGASRGVHCVRDCTIEGNGGAIDGGGVTNWGVQARMGRAIITNAAIFDIQGYAIDSATATVSNCSFSGNGVAIGADRRATVTDSSFAGNNQAIGVGEGKLVLQGSTLTGNKYGILARNVSMEDTTISDSGIYGMYVSKVRARNSSIQGSGTDADCVGNPAGCVDVASSRPPRLDPVTCDTSAHLTPWQSVNAQPTGESWGICALD